MKFLGRNDRNHLDPTQMTPLKTRKQKDRREDQMKHRNRNRNLNKKHPGQDRVQQLLVMEVSNRDPNRDQAKHLYRSITRVRFGGWGLSPKLRRKGKTLMKSIYGGALQLLRLNRLYWSR